MARNIYKEPKSGYNVFVYLLSCHVIVHTKDGVRHVGKMVKCQENGVMVQDTKTGSQFVIPVGNISYIEQPGD